MFESFFARFAQVIPRVKADDDEELIDPQQVLRQTLYEEPETPKQTYENAVPVDPTIPKPVPVKNTPSKNTKPSKILENVKKIDPKTKSLACKTDKNDEDGNGEGGDGDGDDVVELVDPMATLREKCREHRHAVCLAKKLEACNERVSSKSQTSETCVEELFDLLHAIDHCVTPKLFAQLK